MLDQQALRLADLNPSRLSRERWRPVARHADDDDGLLLSDVDSDPGAAVDTAEAFADSLARSRAEFQWLDAGDLNDDVRC
jgi:hypothetical protein